MLDTSPALTPATPPHRFRSSVAPRPGRRWLAPIAAILAGICASVGDAAPTGRPAVDAVIRFAGVFAAVLLGSWAPWWILSAAAAVAIIIAGSAPLAIAAAVALAASWETRLLRDRHTTGRIAGAVSIGITINVLIRAELDRFFGFSAIVVGLVAVVVLVAGLAHCPRRTRWIAVCTALLLSALAGLAAASTGYAVYSVRHQLSGGVRAAELGVASLEHGDIAEAAEWFRQSSDALMAAHNNLSEPWTLPAAAVPVLAQHRDAVVEMSGVGARGAATVVDALESIDLDALRVHDGRIDVDAIAALEQPLREVRAALDELTQATAAARSPWLVGRADYELDDFESSTGEHVASLDDAIRAVADAPAMLGADGPRRYLLLFTTPAESKGLGGFVGTYAELVANDGRLTLEATGQARDLDAAAQRAGAQIHDNAEFLARYGPFGFDTDDHGAVGGAAFRNLTMTPHFPWVGEIAADLYEQTTGRPIDGVIAADPMVLQELLRFTGPVHLDSFDLDLGADNAFGFLLHDQYVVADGDNERREDALDDAATATFAAILDGALPDPIKLSNSLGWLVDQRRLLFWSAHAAEQSLLTDVGATGDLPELDGANGWAFTVSNDGGNKIDTFLQRRTSFRSVTNGDGTVISTLRLELTNTAPSDGLPRYIIGNLRGLPAGTSRLYVSIYSPLDLVAATLDGDSVVLSAGDERSWNVFSRSVDIPSGSTVVLEVELAGTVEDPAAPLVTWEQPMASSLQILEG